jgi:acetyltransferase-like isoleucine patch superfamily enzyme
MLHIEDRGENNTILVPREARERLNGRLRIEGDNNHFEIGRGSVSNEMTATLGSSCVVRVGEGCNLGHLFIYAADKAQIIVGGNSGFNGLVRLLVHEPGQISIGSGCLLAGDVDVTCSDMHSIVDLQTGERVNPARNVVLEDAVWIGQRAMILKGAHIETGSIVGACSVVTGRVAAFSIAAGAPAKVIRTGVTWRRDLI